MALLRRDEEQAFKPSGGTQTLLGAGSEFEGKLNFQGIVHIDGKFSGEIHTPDELNVGQSARINGELFIGHLVVHGEIQGTIHAKNLVELEPTARVFGVIEAPALIVKKGALFEGTSRMGAKPSESKPSPAPGK